MTTDINGPCNKCYGEGIISINYSPLELTTLCPTCNGHGDLYWIDNIIKRGVIEDKVKLSVQQNVGNLINEITRQGLIIGLTLRVEIKDVSIDTDLTPNIDVSTLRLIQGFHKINLGGK